MRFKHNELVTYKRKRWRVIVKGNKPNTYDLATIIKKKTLIKYNVFHADINKIKK